MLIDEALAGPIYKPWWTERGNAERVHIWPEDPVLREATVIIADNVGEYLFSQSFQETWGFDDFPILVPPFGNCWIECRRPSSLRIGEVVYRDPTTLRTFPSRWAIWSFCGAWGDGVKAEDLCPVGEPHLSEWRQIDAAAQDIRWWCIQYLFTRFDNGFVVGPLGACTLLLNSEGQRCIGHPKYAFFANMGADPEETRVLYDQINGFLLFAMAFLTINFLHCKNVQLRTEDPSPSLQRARLKAGKRPLVRHHVLDIHPIRTVLQRQGQSKEVGLKRALHICRGHFKDYRLHGLFGKQHGLYWWDMHLRGEKASGLVTKDYRLQV